MLELHGTRVGEVARSSRLFEISGVHKVVHTSIRVPLLPRMLLQSHLILTHTNTTHTHIHATCTQTHRANHTYTYIAFPAHISKIKVVNLTKD